MVYQIYVKNAVCILTFSSYCIVFLFFKSFAYEVSLFRLLHQLYLSLRLFSFSIWYIVLLFLLFLSFSSLLIYYIILIINNSGNFFSIRIFNTMAKNGMETLSSSTPTVLTLVESLEVRRFMKFTLLLLTPRIKSTWWFSFKSLLFIFLFFGFVLCNVFFFIFCFTWLFFVATGKLLLEDGENIRCSSSSKSLRASSSSIPVKSNTVLLFFLFLVFFFLAYLLVILIINNSGTIFYICTFKYLQKWHMKVVFIFANSANAAGRVGRGKIDLWNTRRYHYLNHF